MVKVAVLDDWQGVARSSADWSPLLARAEVVFVAQAFTDEDDAAAKLADFEIVLSMRERTPLPASLINRLPKLRMLGITGVRNASLDTAACAACWCATRLVEQIAGTPPRSWRSVCYWQRREGFPPPTRISARADSRKACRSASVWREKPSGSSDSAVSGRVWPTTAGR